YHTPSTLYNAAGESENATNTQARREKRKREAIEYEYESELSLIDGGIKEEADNESQSEPGDSIMVD
ncbi:hypothetical protein ACHAO1_006736, partial [Botrytis cinerea]